MHYWLLFNNILKNPKKYTFFWKIKNNYPSAEDLIMRSGRLIGLSITEKGQVVTPALRDVMITCRYCQHHSYRFDLR